MADFQFNIAKGKSGTLYANVDAASPANCAIIVVPIETTGIEAQATLQDYDDLLTLLAAANNEQSTMGRKNLLAAQLTTAVNDTSNAFEVTTSSITWTAATGNAISRLLFCYDPDTTGGTDSTVIPLFAYDLVATPDG